MPYTLVGPTITGPVQDLLAVLRLDNRLYISGFLYAYAAANFAVQFQTFNF